jgi:hypothetical protein
MPKTHKAAEGGIKIVTNIPLPKRSCGPRGSLYYDTATSLKVGSAAIFATKSPALTMQKHLNRLHGKGAACVRQCDGEWGCWRVR